MGRHRVRKAYYSSNRYWVLFDDMAFRQGLFAIASRTPYRIAFADPSHWRRERTKLFGFSSRKPLHRR